MFQKFPDIWEPGGLSSIKVKVKITLLQAMEADRVARV
jgi:hypothetical protein